MMSGLGTRLRQPPGISVSAFYDAFKALLLQKYGWIHYESPIGVKHAPND